MALSHVESSVSVALAQIISRKEFSLSDFCKVFAKTENSCFEFLLFTLSGTLDVGITQPLNCWFMIGSKKQD